MQHTEEIVLQVRQKILACADTLSVSQSLSFFKEGEAPQKIHGVKKTADVNRIAKDSFKEIKNRPKNDVFDCCEALFASGYMEEMTVACKWAEMLHKQYEPADFCFFERWLDNYVDNWATCDNLCPHAIGTFVMKFPEYVSHLKIWAKSTNRWMRRGAAVTLIIPARKGLFLDDILEIAEILLLDKDDLVQKGYGWMLKAASMSEIFVKGTDEQKKEHLNAVFDFVMKHKAIMPRTALRYAIEKMPDELKKKAMKK